MNFCLIMRIFLIMFLINITLYSQSGLVTGKVYDSRTKEALVGVNIQIKELKNVGTSTDLTGAFKIKLPVGSYSIQFSLVGYTTLVRTGVVVKAGAEITLDVFLAESVYEVEGTTVSADFFNKSVLDNNISSLQLGSEEVKRSPGTSLDYQRLLQGMAGVSFSNDQNNELLVRGGAPDENLTVYDNIEIHSTNHYPNQFNSGGPINMVNVDLIQDIQFSTGGFISKYGDKLSSVQIITTREGTRERYFKGNANITMAGYGAILEGKFSEKASWILSARKSYIDLIAGSFGLTAIPYYYDLQCKISYDFSDAHKLSISGLYGNDKINIEGDIELEDSKYANIGSDTVAYENIDVFQQQYVAGLTLTSFWSKDFYSKVTISNNSFDADLKVTNDLTIRNFDTKGKKISSSVIKTADYYKQNQRNGETAIKAEFNWNISKWNELNFGGSVKFINFYTDEKIAGDTVRFDINNDGKFDTIVTRNPAQFNYDLAFPEFSKQYVYINDKIKLLNERLIFNLGLRYDYFNYSKQGNISPRISIAYYFIPLIFSFNLAYGEYYQVPALPLFIDRYKLDINRELKNSHARHFVAGFEYIIDEGLKLNIEGYYKKYFDLPVREEFVHFLDRKFRSEKILNVGKQDVTGIDVFLQQKLVKNIYGTISFSRMWTKYYDPRIGFEGKTFTSENDFPYTFTIILGSKFKDLRKKLDEMPFYIKYPSYILPFSDDMEISFKWRYASGKPYTKKIFITSEQHLNGGLIWSKGTWIDSEEIFTERYPDYHRLDLSFYSRYNYESWSISLFLSIQNLYNRKNIFFYNYNSDGTIDNVYQFSFMPVLGVEINF